MWQASMVDVYLDADTDRQLVVAVELPRAFIDAPALSRARAALARRTDRQTGRHCREHSGRCPSFDALSQPGPVAPSFGCGTIGCCLPAADESVGSHCRTHCVRLLDVLVVAFAAELALTADTITVPPPLPATHTRTYRLAFAFGKRTCTQSMKA